jgi:hypothetical protein
MHTKKQYIAAMPNTPRSACPRRFRVRSEGAPGRSSHGMRTSSPSTERRKITSTVGRVCDAILANRLMAANTNAAPSMLIAARRRSVVASRGARAVVTRPLRSLARET